MDLPVNAFKRALSEGRQQKGLWCTIRDPAVVEMLAGTGADWLLIDCEHAPSGPADVLGFLQAAGRSGPSTMVRPSQLDPAEIKRLLDVGAQNILVPYVQTVEEARLAAASVAYPPDGIRGAAGMVRAALYGGVPDYFARARDEIGLYVQIETRAGLDAIEEIAAVEGIDGIFIGPADLATSLGHKGDYFHPDVRAQIMDAMRRIRAAGQPAGFLGSDQGLLADVVAAGSLFTAVGVDILLLRHAAQGQIAASTWD